MSRMELLCCRNSRTLHFSGLTSHCIHLPASCQFRGERVKEKEKKKKRLEGGSHQSVCPLPPARLAERLPFHPLFPWWPVQLVICIITHTFTHCSYRAGGRCLCLLAAAQWVALDLAGSQKLWHKTACSWWMTDPPRVLFPRAADLAGQRWTASAAFNSPFVKTPSKLGRGRSLWITSSYYRSR